ncbi:hypothetical protein ACFORL_11530 [Legionella dresdenensis]|uniref:Protein SidH n=1 Tax=Legionella dresdenensis TaxID=450200 RepID=A0ABV8CHA0_9GAMM
MSLKDTIQQARAQIVTHLEANLSDAVIEKIKFDLSALPYTDIKQDAPQVAAVKTLLNSLYYAEQIVNGLENKKAALGNMVLSPIQTAKSCWNLYQTVCNFSVIISEAGGLLGPDIDLLQPVLTETLQLVEQSAAWEQIKQFDAVNNSGAMLAAGINALKPAPKASVQSTVIVEFANQIPGILNQINQALNNKGESRNIGLSQVQLDAMSRVADIAFDDKLMGNVSLNRFAKTAQGLQELINQINTEKDSLTEETRAHFKSLLKQNISDLLCLLDEIECTNYLKAGILSNPLLAALAKQLGLEVVEECIKRSQKQRLEALGYHNIAAQEAINEVDRLQGQSNKFFSLLRKYEGQRLSALPAKTRNLLRQYYKDIQPAVAHQNLELDKMFVEALNDEKSPQSIWDHLKKFNVTLVEFLSQNETNHYDKLQTGVNEYYKSQKDSQVLKQDVIVSARHKLQGIRFNELRPYSHKSKLELFEVSPETQRAQNKLVLDSVNAVTQCARQLTWYLTERPASGPGFFQPAKVELDAIRKTYLKGQEIIHRLDPELDKKFVAALNTGNKEELVELAATLNSDQLRHSLEAVKTSVEAMRVPLSKPEPVTELLPVKRSSLNTMRGHFAALQELKISKLSSQALKYVQDAREPTLSKRVAARFTAKLPHVIADDDPAIVRQVKLLENGIHELNSALEAFEQINPEAGVMKLMWGMKNVGIKLLSVNSAFQSLAPELQERYRAAVDKLNDFKELIVSNENQLTGLANVNRQRTQIENGIYQLKEVARLMAKGERKLRVNLEWEPGKTKNFTLEELSNPEMMDKEIRKLVNSLDKLLPQQGGNRDALKNIQIVKQQLSKFLQRVGSALGTVNKAAMEKLPEMKAQLYKEVLQSVSQLEDDNYLKPGILLVPALQYVDKLFYSLVINLNLPYDDKVAVLKDSHFIDDFRHTLREQRKELILANPKNELDPLIKADKLEFADTIWLQHLTSYENNHEQLLDVEYGKILAKAMAKAGQLQSPFREQFKGELDKFYQENRKQLLGKEYSVAKFTKDIAKFEQGILPQYRFLQKVCSGLDEFCNNHKEITNTELAGFIDKKKQQFTDAAVPVSDRFQQAHHLAKDPELVEMSRNSSLARKFINWIKDIVSAVTATFASTESLEKRKATYIVSAVKEVYKEKTNLESRKEDLSEPEVKANVTPGA